jgi:hypothetical protein
MNFVQLMCKESYFILFNFPTLGGLCIRDALISVRVYGKIHSNK